MRLLTAISIASLVVSIAAVVFVLGLYDELEKSGSETPKAHTQELNETMVTSIITDHVRKLITSAGITHDNKYEMDDVWAEIPGVNCLWGQQYLGPDNDLSLIPNVHGIEFVATSYNYIKADDIWLATSAHFQCEELTTWAIDDNTGEVTYGHPDEK